MGINWRQAFAGVANSVGATSGLLIQDEVQKTRDARMNQYRQAEVADERAYQGDVRADEQAHDINVRGLESEATAKAATLQREQEVADSQLEHDRGQEDIRLRADLDPQAPVTNITNQMGEREDKRSSSFGDALGKVDAERYAEVIATVDAAPDVQDAIHVMEELGKAHETGTIQKLMAEGGKYFGTDAAAALQTWDVASSPLVLSLASQMAGVLSETDMKIVLKGVADFGNSPTANSVAFDLLRKGIERSKENQESMESWLMDHTNLSGWRAPNRQGRSIAKEMPQDGTRPADDPLGFR